MIELNAVHPMVTALGWTLVHFLWQGLVIGAVYSLLIGCLRDATAATRYWVGMGTLAAMFLGTVVTFAAVYQPLVPMSSGPAISVGATSVQAVSVDVSGWEAFKFQLEIFLPWAVLAWLSGVFLLSGRIALDFWRIRKLAIDGVQPMPDPWPALVKRMCRSLGMSRAVSVVESARVSVPIVIGWLKPVILIPPSALLGLTHKQLELIISHELAHVKRLDYFFNVLQIVVETLLFYHPFVRHVAVQVRLERENCCDDIVVACSGDTLAYASALTEVEGMRCSSGMQVVLAATGGNLVGRVRRLAGMPAPQRGAIQWFAAVMLIGASATVFTGAQYAAVHRNVDEPLEVAGTASVPVPVERTIEVPESEPEAVSVAAEDRAPAINRIEIPVVVQPDIPTETPTSSAEVEPVPPATILVSAAIEQPIQAIGTSDLKPAAVPDIASPLVSENAAEPVHLPSESAPAGQTDKSMPKVPAPTEVPEASQPIMGGGSVTKPVGPKYPRQAKLRGIEGFVKVGYTVNREGRVENVEVLDAVPAQIFNSTVVKALAKWRYEPFTVDGAPSAQTVTQVFEFNVERGELDEAEKPARCRRNTGTRLCRDSMDPGITGVSVVYNTL
jgi:bla regulator protein BlaR1